MRPAKPSGQRGELRRAGDGPAGEFAHPAIVACAAGAVPHSGCGGQRRCVHPRPRQRTPPATRRAARPARPGAVCTTMAQSPAATAVSVVSAADRGRAARPGAGAPAGPAAPATRGRGRSGAGPGSAGTGRGRAHQRPDEHPVALGTTGRCGHAAAPPRLAGLGRRAPRPRSGPPASGTRGAGVVAQVEVERLRGGRAGVDPPDPAGAQQRREGLRKARPSPLTTTCWRGARREQRVTVAGQPVGGRQGVGVGAQGRPPGLAEVAQEGPVGRQVEQQVALAQRLRAARSPAPARRRCRAARASRAGRSRLPSSRATSADLGLAQALEDDAGVAGQSRPAARRAPAQELACGLSRGRAAIGSLLRRPSGAGRRLWHAAGDRGGRRRPQADGPPGQSKGRDPSRARGPALVAVRWIRPCRGCG